MRLLEDIRPTPGSNVTRIDGLSDCVIAVAFTLFVVNMHLPPDGLSESQLQTYIKQDILPDILFYLGTYLVVASSWISHYRIIPSALGSVIFFTLALIGATIPILSTIITEAAPAAHRGTVLGTYVAISTLSGLIAPLVTGVIIQAAGRNIATGFYHAYLLASLLLLLGGVAFLAFARPTNNLQKGPLELQHIFTRSPRNALPGVDS